MANETTKKDARAPDDVEENNDEARQGEVRRGKTRDAFAFKNLSSALEETIGEYVIPAFAYEPVGDDVDEEGKAFGIISDWLAIPYNEMTPYRGFERVKEILAHTALELERIRFRLDCIDVHIGRLRRYLLSVQKKMLEEQRSVANEIITEQRKARASYLLWHYEWIKDVLTAYMVHVEKYNESQQENLQQQYKREFAERLRFARMKKKMNQAEVAAQLGLTPQAYSNYERGARDLPIFAIYRLKQILGVSADYLFD